MRPGIIWTGTTMRARTGAFTTWRRLGLLDLPLADRGSISQKVSVKSKGEFWIEQKLL